MGPLCCSIKVTTKVWTQRMSVLSTFTRLSIVCCLSTRSEATGTEDPGARPASNAWWGLDSYIDTASFRITWKLDQDQSQGKLSHQQLPSTNIKCEESNIAHRSAWDWYRWLRFPAGTSRCWSWCRPPPRWLLAANWRRLSAEKSEIMAHFSLHMEPTTEEQ